MTRVNNLFYDINELERLRPGLRKRQLWAWKGELQERVSACSDFLRRIDEDKLMPYYEAVKALKERALAEIEIVNTKLEALDDTV